MLIDELLFVPVFVRANTPMPATAIIAIAAIISFRFIKVITRMLYLKFVTFFLKTSPKSS